MGKSLEMGGLRLERVHDVEYLGILDFDLHALAFVLRHVCPPAFALGPS
jgi:hypothetical protein